MTDGPCELNIPTHTFLTTDLPPPALSTLLIQQDLCCKDKYSIMPSIRILC